MEEKGSKELKKEGEEKGKTDKMKVNESLNHEIKE